MRTALLALGVLTACTLLLIVFHDGGGRDADVRGGDGEAAAPRARPAMRSAEGAGVTHSDVPAGEDPVSGTTAGVSSPPAGGATSAALLQGALELPSAAAARFTAIVLHVARLPRPGEGRGVEVRSLEAAVDRRGRWRLAGLDPGTYVVQAVLDGEPLSGGRVVDIGPGAQATVALPSRPTVRVRGVVGAEADGRALVGARVRVPGWVPARADATGAFTLADLPAGEHELIVTARGYVPAVRVIDVPEQGEPEPVIVRLARGISLTLDVLDAGGGAAGGVTVQVSGPHHVRSAVSDPGGRIVVEGLAIGGSYDVRVVQPPGAPPASVRIPPPESIQGIRLRAR